MIWWIATPIKLSQIYRLNLYIKFTEDLRENAQRYKDRNVPGADVVWEELKDMHVSNPSEPEIVNP